MPAIRFRSRFLHATIFEFTRTELGLLGWTAPPVNFGATPLTLIDYQPEERSQQIAHNTVAVSLGDYPSDDDEELGAAWHGGARSAPYTVFIDVYMEEQALAQAICDDIRDIFTDRSLNLINQITMTPMPNLIEIETIDGPTRPDGTSIDAFRKHWRVMRLDARLFFQT